MATEVKVPTLGESITEATLGQWLKMPGDAVKADEPVASLETDKVAIEVPSPVDGVMGDQLVAVGDTVAVQGHRQGRAPDQGRRPRRGGKGQGGAERCAPAPARRCSAAAAAAARA